MNDLPEAKIKYWQDRMNEELEKGYKQTADTIRRAMDMATFIGIDRQDFEDGIIEIGDGFNSLKALIDGKTPVKLKIPKDKKTRNNDNK